MNQEYQTPVNPENNRVLESVPQNSQTESSVSPADLEKNVSHFRHFYFGSLLYGLFFAFCLYRNANGITYPFFVGGTLFFFCSCIKKLGLTAKRDSLYYVISLLLLGTSSFLTNSEPLIFMNTIGIFLLGFSFAIHCFYEDRDWSFSKHFSAIFFIAFGSISCLFRPFQDMNWYLKAKNMSTKNKRTLAVLSGILISIPLVIVVTLLLYSADVIFADFFDRFFYKLKYFPENIIGIIFHFLFAFFAFYCIWVFLCQKKIKAEDPDKRTGDPVIAITFTGIISFVYLLFCFIQVRYLFLGNIPLSKGFNYSDYARQGFFQLLFVCLINLVMVLICLGRFRDHKILKGILTVITVCTYIMIASSAMRMLLYIIYYNLTFLRVMVLWALLIIFVLITGVVITIYKPAFPLFRFSVGTVTVLYLIFSFGHPDYWIAKYNLEPHTHTIKSQNLVVESVSDYDYLRQLSTDAAPVLLSENSAFKDSENIVYYERYIRNIERAISGKDNLRSFNVSRFIASRLLPAEGDSSSTLSEH